MSARYTPLSNPRSAPDAERELEDAFDLDDENEDDSNAHESTPLTHHTNNVVSPQHSGHVRTESTGTPNSGAYDFERAYDFPPPGSPPAPSSRALPNDYGNTNGLLPTAPPAIPKPKRSFFQRTLGAILPTHYQLVPTQSHSGPTGGGTENDGVFANVTAKPQAPRMILGEDGYNYVVPEDSQKETPPVSLSLAFTSSITTSICEQSVSIRSYFDPILILTINKPTELPRGTSRCRPTLLGDNHPCSWRRRRRRPHHRRPAHRLLPYLLPQYLRFILLPVHWIPLDLSPAYLTCRKVRLARGVGLDSYPVRLLLADNDGGRRRKWRHWDHRRLGRHSPATQPIWHDTGRPERRNLL